MTRQELNELIRSMLVQLGRDEPDFELPTENADIIVLGDGPIFDRITFDGGKEVDHQTVEGEQVAFLTLERITAQIAREIEGKSRSHSQTLIAKLIGRLRRSPDAYITRHDDYSRRTWMDAQVRLMSSLRSDWGVRVELRHDEMLRRFPLTKRERENARRLDLSQFGLE